MLPFRRDETLSPSIISKPNADQHKDRENQQLKPSMFRRSTKMTRHENIAKAPFNAFVPQMPGSDHHHHEEGQVRIGEFIQWHNAISGNVSGKKTAEWPRSSRANIQTKMKTASIKTRPAQNVDSVPRLCPQLFSSLSVIRDRGDFLASDLPGFPPPPCPQLCPRAFSEQGSQLGPNPEIPNYRYLQCDPALRFSVPRWGLSASELPSIAFAVLPHPEIPKYRKEPQDHKSIVSL